MTYAPNKTNQISSCDIENNFDINYHFLKGLEIKIDQRKAQEITLQNTKLIYVYGDRVGVITRYGMHQQWNQNVLLPSHSNTMQEL